MPKVYLTKNDKKDEQLRRLIKMAMAREGIDSQRELAKRLKCREQTVSYRLRHPDSFTREELKDYCRVLRISGAELGEVLI